MSFVLILYSPWMQLRNKVSFRVTQAEIDMYYLSLWFTGFQHNHKGISERQLMKAYYRSGHVGTHQSLTYFGSQPNPKRQEPQ